MLKSANWEVRGIAMCAVYQVLDTYNSHIVDLIKRECTCKYVLPTCLLYIQVDYILLFFLSDLHICNLMQFQAMATFGYTVWSCVCCV